MKPFESNVPVMNAAEWEKRKRGNKRLGYIIGIIVLAIFLASIWKYRPL